MPAPTVRILGIDPGLRVTGFGVIEKNGASLSYIASGCVKSGDADLADRLKTILAGLREIIGEHRPQQVARLWSANQRNQGAMNPSRSDGSSLEETL